MLAKNLHDLKTYERLLAHAISRANRGRPERVDGLSALTGMCGDTIEISVTIRDNVVADIKCNPDGCIYVEACADAVVELARGKSVAETWELTTEDVEKELGDVLPENHRLCAQLALDALREAIEDYIGRTGLKDEDVGEGTPAYC